jgi:hypothetical protein
MIKVAGTLALAKNHREHDATGDETVASRGAEARCDPSIRARFIPRKSKHLDLPEVYR